jgi:large repetitive protein
VTASGGPPTGSLHYLYTGGPPGCVFVSQSSGTCTPNGATGPYTISVTVTDSVGGKVTGSATLTVNAQPQVTAFTATPTLLDVGQNLSLLATVTGGTAPLTFVYTGLPTGCVSMSVANLTCTVRGPGTPTPVVTVTDHFGKTATLSVDVTINAAPSIPSFSAAPPNATLGDSVTFSTTVAGGSPSFHYQYANLPAGCLSSDVAPLHCLPTVTGSFVVAVTVTDAVGGAAHASATLNVSAPSTGGSGSTFLGLPLAAGYGIIAVILIVAVIAVLIARARRGKTPPESEGGAPATEEPAAVAEWQEPPPS